MPDQSSNLTALRGAHVATYYVSRMTGSLVYSAEVTSATATAIAITGGSGTIGDVKPGMRVVVTTSGGDPRGVVSVRYSGSISTSSIPIRETSTIGFAAGDLVYVYNDFLLTDKLVESSASFSPDGIAVSAENTTPRPRVCSGGWYAGWLPASGSLAITLYGADSATVDINSSGAITHAWSTSGGTLSSSSATSPVLTVTAAGYYLVTHTVTDDTNGMSETQYVPILIHDANNPPYECILSSVDGDAASGFRASFELFGDVTLSDLPDGSPVVVWAADTINGTAQAFGHKVSDRSHILMTGYLRRDTTRAGADGAESVEFEVISPLARLAELPGFSKVMVNEASPDAWSEIANLYVSRAILQILRYYTNALQLFDLLFVGMTDKEYPAFYLNKSTPYEQVKELADAVDCVLVCDRVGRFELQQRLELTALASRSSPATTITLTTDDIIDYEVTREHWKPVETVRFRGFTQGFTNAVVPVFARYPATPGTGNSSPVFDKMIVDDATDLLTRCALRGAYENRVFIDSSGVERHAPTMRLTLFGAYARLFQGYREWISFSGITTLRGVVLSDFRWIWQTVSETYENGTAVCTLTLQAETAATDAVDDAPASEGTGTGDPPVTYPPIVVTDPPVDGNNLGVNTGTIAVFDSTNNKVHITTGFNLVKSGGTPSFTGYTLSVTGALSSFAYKAGTNVNGYLATISRFYPISDIFGARTLGTAYVYAGGAAADVRQVQLQSERGNPSAVIIAVYNDTDGTNAYYSADGGVTWAAGTGLPTAYDSNLPANAGTWMPGLWIAPDGSGNALVSACTATGNPPGADFYSTSNGGASWSLVSTSGWDAGEWTCGSIAKPLSGTATYHGYVYYSSGVKQGIRRIVGTTQTDISPVVSATTYGTGYGNTVGQRAISIADDDSNAICVVGYNAGNSKFGVFQSFDRGATWNTIITPDTSVLYRGNYYVSRDTIYLYGASGALALCKYAAGAWSVYATTVSGCGTIVGIVGG